MHRALWCGFDLFFVLVSLSSFPFNFVVSLSLSLSLSLILATHPYGEDYTSAALNGMR
jgi:hypothetical protein